MAKEIQGYTNWDSNSINFKDNDGYIVQLFVLPQEQLPSIVSQKRVITTKGKQIVFVKLNNTFANNKF